MLPASIDSLMPTTAADAPRGRAGASVLSSQGPGEGAESALSAFAALLQSGLATAPGADGETTPTLTGGSDSGLPALLPELIDAAEGLPPGGKMLPMGAVVGEMILPTQPLAVAGQNPTNAVNNDASSVTLDDLVGELQLEQKPTSARDVGRIQAEFARLVAAARLNATEALPADADPTTLAPLQATAGETRAADPSQAARPLTLNTPLQHADWNNQFAQRITWLASHKIQAAELRLNPQHLGPIDIQIRMDGDQANLVFGAAHAQVRDAIEAALPRLREMFAAQGLNVAQVDVNLRDGGERQFAGGEGGSHGNGAGAGGSGSDSEAGELNGATGPVAIQAASGLVDIFA
jgi:hypothetical protein